MITRNLKVFLASLALTLLAGWGINMVQEPHANPQAITAQIAQLQLEQQLRQQYPQRNRGAQPLELQASSTLAVYLKQDGTTKVLFEKNSEAPLPIASITKLMTALLALKNYTSDTTIAVTPEILETPGEAGKLKQGDVFSTRDLLYLSLMESSNDAAFALATPLGIQTFVALMNEEAERLNLRHTSFVNPTGLDGSEKVNLSTAKDLVKFTRYLLENYPQIFDILSQNELPLFGPDGTFHHTMRNTNELLGYYDWPARTLGGKTGTSPQANQTLLFVVESPDRKGYIINVILGSENRFQEMRQLLQWILQSFQWQT